MNRSVWIGWEPREAAAFAVARYSIQTHATTPIPVRGVVLNRLRKVGMYWRPTEIRDGRLWDTISEAPMATEFAISRFLVADMASRAKRMNLTPRWAVFMDCDMLVRCNIGKLFDACDPEKAVMVVKHQHNPEATVKMDGQIQTRYARKNWSSVCAFNLDHPANKKLTVDLVNTVPGRDLHAFCWLEDDEIGELDPKWNYLVGHTKITGEPAIVHFTDGIPLMQGYENAEYADEWRSALHSWAS